MSDIIREDQQQQIEELTRHNIALTKHLELKDELIKAKDMIIDVYVKMLNGVIIDEE